MDRPAVIQTSGSVWITDILVWIGGMYRPVGSGYGSGFYILTRSHLAQPLLTRQGQLSKTQICYSHLRLSGARHITAEHVGIWKGFLRELLVCSAACPSFIKLWCPRPRPMVFKLEAKALSERGPKSLHWTQCTRLLLIKAAKRTSRMVFPNHDLTSMSLGRT